MDANKTNHIELEKMYNTLSQSEKKILADWLEDDDYIECDCDDFDIGDFDMEDIYDSITSFDKETLVEWLDDDGYLDDVKNSVKGGNFTHGGLCFETFIQAIENLKSNYFTLSQDEIDRIVKMGNLK